MSLRTAIFCAAAMGLALSTLSAPASAATAAERREACSKEWNAAKEAGKVPVGQTWSKFYSECNARLKADEEAKAAKPADKKTTEAKPAAAPAAAESTRESRMKQCSAEWQAAKDAGKVPAGQTWPKFYSECNTRLSGEAPAAAPAPATAAKPVAPAAKPAAAKVEDDEDTGEGVREPTPGQLAARARMKECGAQWRATKEAGKIPEGQTWPQYWSACNKRLKAAGK